ncbi:mechanosensitive ion channel family protein [Cellulosilyticum sp. I15G10I2]|uniref:mechanosensitive ion channel family protein n=1 Tax=Cellulosilyticum sp. I15G10I2 TaxID=1892843 RepID=UPI002E8E1A49|nr:mechanosensitive ion channel family protein [Cellulosilyticum sp. I15G10I2]
MWIEHLLVTHGVHERVVWYLSNVIAVMIVLIISLIVDLIVRKVLLRYIKSYAAKTKAKWDDVLVEKKVFERLARIVPIGIIHAFAPVFPAYEVWIQRIAFSFIVFIVLLAINRFLDAMNTIYLKYEISKIRPIKGYLQVVEIIAYVIGTIVIVSVLIDRSPWILLSGIGAATAVLLLIFQNSILGLVASIQISSNNMLQIGDWIEMPKYGADGDVLEISLHTVKVQNFDKTITTIPTHALISESFKNWRGMQEAGGRRIKRAVYIDVTSIKFCDEAMLERFEKIEYLKAYLQNKRKEIAAYNKIYDVNDPHIVNGRHLTNIGTFRMYIENYLRHHPKVSQDMIHIVRQLPPSENGLPIEIYAFTSEIAWENYESIQADLFDHILAIVPEFDLRIYQRPTGHDFSSFKKVIQD